MVGKPKGFFMEKVLYDQLLFLFKHLFPPLNLSNINIEYTKPTNYTTDHPPLSKTYLLQMNTLPFTGRAHEPEKDGAGWALGDPMAQGPFKLLEGPGYPA